VLLRCGRELDDRAAADLRVAELTLLSPDLPAWPAGLHLQQAAEKALEAVLVSQGLCAPRTHDRALLAETAAQVAPKLQVWGERLLALGDFAVAQRYPGAPHPQVDLAPMVAEVRWLLADAQALCNSTG
jgi:HEPN domain-containing protein